MPPSAEQIFQAAQTAAVYFALPDRPLVTVSGPDAARYLHGRLTQNIKDLKDGTGSPSLLLTPQGRVQGHCLISRLEGCFVFVADPDRTDPGQPAGKSFLRALLQFKVADQLTAELLNDTHSLLSLQGPRAPEILTALGWRPPGALGEISEQPLAGGAAWVIAHRRGAESGFDVIIPHELEQKLADALVTTDRGVLEGTAEGFEMLRIRAGIPQAGNELTEKTVATEIDVSALVSFNKGCYAGQEVVEMSTARGRPNRKLWLLRARKTERIGAGDAIAAAEKTAGEVTSACFAPSEDCWYFLAFIKTAVADDAALTIAGAVCERLSR